MTMHYALLAADRAPTFLRNSSSVQSLRAISSGPPEDPVLQALKAGMAEHRNDSVRLFGKLVTLGQGIHLPHLLVDEMQAMAREHATPAGGEPGRESPVPCMLCMLGLLPACRGNIQPCVWRAACLHTRDVQAASIAHSGTAPTHLALPQ